MTEVEHVSNYSHIPGRKREVPPALDIMARTIFGEARGETFQGKIEVAHVIINRAEIGGWWGDTIIRVCLKPWQFSCWNKNDPNSEILAGLDYRAKGAGSLRDCMAIAHGARAGWLPSNLDGKATHYFNPEAVERVPDWVEGATKLGAVGHHIFFKDVR